MDGRRDNLAVLVCRVHARLCAWPLASVDEILRHQPLRPLTAPAAHVPGLARIRGRWIPVVDLASALNLGPGPLDRLVVVHQDGRPAALAVSEVIGVQRLERTAVETLPLLLQHGQHDPVEGVATLNQALVALLDLGRLLPAEALEPAGTPDGEARETRESAA